MIKMSILKNIRITENLTFFVFLKIFTIIILLWIYHPHDDAYSYRRTTENKSGCSLNISFTRYLSEYEDETKIDKPGLYKNSPNYFEIKGTSNYDDNVSIYGNMMNRDSKKLKLYKTSYNHRYSKKKGLSKLDCYYEKKIFDKIEDIDKLVEKMKNDKKSFKKVILNKYGIYIFLILFPLLGLIFPVLFEKIFGSNPLIDVCNQTANDESPHCDKIHMTPTAQDSGFYTSAVISLTIGIINIIVIIYILMKIIKYEKLKACKGKMNLKKYCRFCKGIFSNKKN